MAKLLSNTRVYGTGTVDTQLFVQGFRSAHSTASGSLQVSGGIGVSGGGFFGGTVTATNFVGAISGTASLANDLVGGTAGQLVYQVGANDSGFVGPGTVGQLLVSAGAAAPVYTNTGSIYVNGAVNAQTLYGGTAGQLVYQSSGGVTAFAGPGTSGQVLTSGGTGAPVYVNTGSLHVGRAVTVDSFNGIAGSATNIAGGTAGQVPYQTGASATSFFGPGTAGQILVSAGTSAPVYTSTGSIYVGRAVLSDSATNISGGTAGQLHYQSSSGVTAFAGPGTAGQILVSSGTGAPTYTNTGSIYVGRAVLADSATSASSASAATNISGGTAGQLLYQSSPGVTAFAGPGTAGQILVSSGTGAPTYTNTGSIYVNRATLSDNDAGGSTGGLRYQTGANASTFLSIGTAGQILRVNSGSTAPEWISTSSLYVNRAVTADGALTVQSVQQTTNATHFLTFVDSNNASLTSEVLYTSSTIVVNPGTGNVGFGTVTATNRLTVNGNIELNQLLIKTAATEEGTAFSGDGAYAEYICLASTTAYFAALYPGTEIYETNISTGYTTIIVHKTTAPTNGSFSATANRIYSSNMPINLLASVNDIQYSIVPLSMCSTTFVNYTNRSNPSTYYIYSPFGTTTASIYVNTVNGILGTAESSVTVGLNQVATLTTNNLGFHYIQSNSPIVIGATQTGNTDTEVLKPTSRIIYHRFTPAGIATIYGGTPTTGNGVNSLGADVGTGCVFYSDNPLQGTQIADGAGGNCSQGVGIDYLSDTYSLGGVLSDFTIVAPYANTTVVVSYWTGSAWTIWDTIVLPFGKILNPSRAQRDGTTGPGVEGTTMQGSAANMAGGATLWSFSGTKPFAIWINDDLDDEIPLVGWMSKNTALKKQRNDSPRFLGNVSIGTTSTGDQLLISRAVEAATEQLEFRNEGGITTGNYSGIVWTQGSAGATTLSSIRLNYNSSGQPDMTFNLRSVSDLLFLKNDGNVGISNNNPSVKLDITGTGRASSDFRAPIFYDSNDTSYYADPASTSILNIISNNRFQDGGGTFLFRPGTGSGTTRHINLADSTADPSSVGSATGITAGQRSDNAAYYMMYVKAPYNNGYNTYSRLSLGWHTGVEIGGNPTYGGTRFMSDSPGVSTTELMSVGKGDSHVRITNNLYVPIVYDSNNTGYYTDPASTSSLNYAVIRNAISAEGYRFVNPEGGSYVTGASSVTGAIKIKLPTSRLNSSTMMRLTVRLYEYTTGRSTTWEVGGYNYVLGNWYNIFATQLTDSDRGAFTVRFGQDSTSDCIWIGETGSTWSYPQVFITDVQTGYSGFSNDWGAGYAVSFVTSFDTVEQSRTASLILCSNNSNASVPSLGVGTAASGTTGEIRATNEITAYYSDRRLKENVENITDALSKVKSLHGIRYTGNDLAVTFGYSKDKKLVGLFADEVEAVLPEAVRLAPFDSGENNTSKSGENYKTIQYEKLVPLLIEAIKEQSDKMDKLQEEIAELRDKLSANK